MRATATRNMTSSRPTRRTRWCWLCLIADKSKGGYMAIQVKALANGQLGTTSQGDLYTVPASKTTIVKNLRLVNTDTAARTVNLYFKRSGGTSRLISPSAMSLGAGSLAIDDQELTMEAGDK